MNLGSFRIKLCKSGVCLKLISMFSFNMLQYIKLFRKYRIFQEKTEFFPKIKLTHKKQLKLKVAVENILLQKKKDQNSSRII